MTDRATVREQITYLTGRPDRTDAVNVSIDNIVRKLAGTGRYNQALWEASYTTSDVLVTGTTDLASITLPDRFNGIAYVKQTDSCPFDPILISAENASRPSRGYYVSGPSLRIYPVDATLPILVGWYLYPDKLSLDTETNWVLDRMEHLVIDIGTAYTLTAIGDRQSAQALLSFAQAFQRQEIAFAKALSGE